MSLMIQCDKCKELRHERYSTGYFIEMETANGEKIHLCKKCYKSFWSDFIGEPLEEEDEF